ncbi:MAG TPA: (2Fe-2S)-binding protein [Desulfatiglandales bacterium]|nr:(2Fe-2S)-binding protein [Desulfatiglandales bacterium]
MRKTIHFKLNGRPKSLVLDRERMLLWVLRTDFGLTGTKYGCGEGLCGACTVLVNNEPVRSCQFPVEDVDAKEILTIEGLARNGRLHPLQETFIKHDALQCGYCTPGMVLTAYSLLIQNPRPTLEQIREGMNENLCRCGSYQRIILSIQNAVGEMKGGPVL